MNPAPALPPMEPAVLNSPRKGQDLPPSLPPFVRTLYDRHHIPPTPTRLPPAHPLLPGAQLLFPESRSVAAQQQTFPSLCVLQTASYRPGESQSQHIVRDIPQVPQMHRSTPPQQFFDGDSHRATLHHHPQVQNSTTLASPQRQTQLQVMQQRYQAQLQALQQRQTQLQSNQPRQTFVQSSQPQHMQLSSIMQGPSTLPAAPIPTSLASSIPQGLTNMITAPIHAPLTSAVPQVNGAGQTVQGCVPLPGMHSTLPQQAPVQRLSPLSKSPVSPYHSSSFHSVPRGSASPVNGHSPAQLQATGVLPQTNNMHHQQPAAVTQNLTSTKPRPVGAQQLIESPSCQHQSPIMAKTAPPSVFPRDAAALQYWKRLETLLKAARSLTTELKPTNAGLSRPSETPRRIAYDLQGLTAFAADAHVPRQDEIYRIAYQTRAAGDFIDYGVASGHAVWAARILAAVTKSSPPSPAIPDSPINGTCPDQAIEDVRVRIFEAEVSCLPIEFVEELLKRRKSMRKLKSRIDLCVRILLALEGRGRRPTQASLDKMKLQLEKADMQARVEAEREAARKEREKQKLERERQKQERERLKSEQLRKNGVKTDGNKKRKRQQQQSAQANFMKRFVKKEEKDAAQEEEEVVSETSREGFAAPLAKNRDVMSVAWWLRAEMPSSSSENLDNLLKDQKKDPLTAKDLLSHLADCSKRRELAERRIPVVLHEYRQTRKLNAENRTPMFVSRRADVRGQGVTGPVKLLQFTENHRPPFFGTFSRRSRSITGKRPFGKNSDLNYECDSADEWDEDEEGEDLLDVEVDKELATEEAELRKLYGSDDEDDDDFLDDGDEKDEDSDDGEGDDNESGASGDPSSQEVGSPLKGGETGSGVIDLTVSTVKSTGEQNQKRSAKDDLRKRIAKRRKSMLKQSVVIHQVSIPDGSPSPLDRFAVETIEGSQPIQMFNPFVYTSSDVVAEHLKAKPPSLRVARASNMDEPTKLDLAAALMRSGFSKEKIVLQFCEHRKLRGLAVPTKAEIMRAIGEIATKEKRNGDSRALWHLTDQAIARKMAQMNNSPANAYPRASVAVD